MSGIAVEAPKALKGMMPVSEFAIRPCASNEELDRCVALEQQTWGYQDRDVIPRNLFVLAQALGGHVLTAWDGRGALAGFALALAAHEPAQGSGAGGAPRWMGGVGTGAYPVGDAAGAPTAYLHSHMVAVAAGYQDRGLGFALKLAQREDALARGIGVMRWTFDPMMARNAYFNLSRLGAVVRHYIQDFYGRTESALQGGLPTDRLVAEWDLRTDRVRRAVERRPAVERSVVESIPLSPQIARWKQSGALAQAEEAQGELRGRFVTAFGRGLQVEGFLRDKHGGGEYLLVAAHAAGTDACATTES